MTAERMVAELREQPDTVARLAAAVTPKPWADAVAGSPIVFLARGTSDNAARYGGYLFAVRNGRVTSFALPSVVTRYGRHDLVAGGTAVVAISQSGRSPDLVATLHAARRAGSVTLAVTNAPDSPLAEQAAHVLDLGCGPELAVAATKSYTASLAALVALSEALAGRSADALTAIVPALQAAVDTPVDARGVELLAQHRRCMVVGRGFHLATAHEGALKLQELTGVMTQPFSPADLEHGPIAALGPDVPVVLVATTGPMVEPCAALLDRIRDRRSPVLVVSDVPDLLERADVPIALPTGIPEWLAPLVAIVPLQRLALRTAQQLGTDVDAPHGLTKVTETR